MISSTLGGEKNERFDWSLSVKEGWRGRLVIGNELLINSILVLKKALKFSTKRSYSAEVRGGSGEDLWSMEFAVFQKALELGGEDSDRLR